MNERDGFPRIEPAHHPRLYFRYDSSIHREEEVRSCSSLVSAGVEWYVDVFERYLIFPDPFNVTPHLDYRNYRVRFSDNSVEHELLLDRKGELEMNAKEDYNKKLVLTEWNEIDGTNDKALCNDNRRRLYS